MPLPFGTLVFLYVGSKDVARDLAYYRDVLGAEVVWDREADGDRVAAVRLGKGPTTLLADHRPAGTCICLYEVPDLKATALALKKRGWKPEGRSFEIPNGPCYIFEDPSGNRYGIFENARPHLFD